MTPYSSSKIVTSINQRFLWSYVLRVILALLRCFLMIAIVVSVAAHIMALNFYGIFDFFIFSLPPLFYFYRPEPFRKISEFDLNIFSEMDAGSSKNPPLWNLHSQENHQKFFTSILKKIREAEVKKIVRDSGTILIGFLLLSLLQTENNSALRRTIKKGLSGTPQLTLTISQGAQDPSRTKILLNKHSKEIVKLLVPNLVTLRLDAVDDAGSPPSVELRKDAETFQKFQMDKKDSFYELNFALSENLDAYVPTLSEDKQVAFEVLDLPKPKVLLTSKMPLKNPWPDQSPLDLVINVTSENSLNLIYLLIKTGKKEVKELVHTITNNDLKSLTTDYTVNLERFMEEDIVDFEIQALAIDHSIPLPQTGFSLPLRFRAASAYGRYRQTLETLAKLKNSLDQKIVQQKPEILDQDMDILKQGLRESSNSPFFDSLDRMQLLNINEFMSEAKAQPSMLALYQISDQVNRFLEEHEILDDRERDRDFFVAARGLARSFSAQSTQIQRQIDRMKSFLGDRKKRWEVRLARLTKPDNIQPLPKVQQGDYFQKSMQALKNESNIERASEKLSRIVSDYREWIEALEKQEDLERQKKEDDRQQGLASSQEKLKELQKMQGEISEALDKAETQTKDDLDNKWPIAQAKENSNLLKGDKLEANMRAQAPDAAARLKVALEAMQETLKAGDGQQYTAAESFSDLAGRLLREALKDSQQSRDKQGRRKRKRPSGEDYFGQAVHGGDVDVDRQYHVDKKFREDILDQVQAEDYDEETKPMMDHYLRGLIR